MLAVLDATVGVAKLAVLDAAVGVILPPAFVAPDPGLWGTRNTNTRTATAAAVNP